MGRKEDNIGRAQALMRKPEQIRNIGTAAHIDHGKCFALDTEFRIGTATASGPELIGRVQGLDPAALPPEGAFFDLPELIVEAVDADLRLRRARASLFLQPYRGALVRVRTEEGTSLSVTPNHRFLVASGEGVAWRRADALSKGTPLVAKRTCKGLELNARAVPGLDQIAYVDQAPYRGLLIDLAVPRYRNFLVGPSPLVVHNTTLSDNLIAGAGMMSEELAGKQLLLDYDEQEQARGITINAANASMVHNLHGTEYLINLIDTPGHVDFGGDVTRAMRALDGVIIVVCAVEGVMPQTETVIRQAVKEKVKPVLFINKVDRLINELQVTPQQMQERFATIIREVSARIQKLLPPELREPWALKVESGNIIFGSAFNKWAISVPYMTRSGISFKEIYEHCKAGDQKGLAKRAPLHEVLLDAVIQHHPNPLIAQKLRVPQIWRGDPTSEVGTAMLRCDPNGQAMFMVTKIIMDPHAGEVAVGRLFSGKLSRGQELWISGMPNPNRIQMVALSVGADRIAVEEIDAGNIAAVTGLKDAIAGSTVSSDKSVEPFERMVHYTEPVVTLAIEAKHMKDLPKLVDVLRTVAKADPSIQIEIDQETGEHLLSGMGELHLEITTYRIVNEHKVDINTSEPIVVFRERVEGKGGPFEGKSPNKHNRFYLEAEKLPEAVVAAIKAGEIPADVRIKDAKALAKQLVGLGMDREEAKGVVTVHGTNLLLDLTKGIQYLHETMELVKEAFLEAMDQGPLAQEKCMGLKVSLVDAKLHEDSIHRGPAQVIPAVRSAIYGAMCEAGRALYEPMVKVFVNLPQDVMGDAIREIQQRRGVIEDMHQEGEITTVSAKAPISAMFGFAASMRSATSGRALWSTENSGFEPMPRELQAQTVAQIRTRKGLKPEPYDTSYYAA